MTIVICYSCEGKGYHECSDVTDYHKREYKYWNETCTTCNGKGRLKQVIKLEVLPDVEVKK